MLVWLLWELYSGLPPQYLPDNHANHSVASYIIHVALFDEFLQWFFFLIVVFENGDSERGRRSLPTRRSMVRFFRRCDNTKNSCERSNTLPTLLAKLLGSLLRNSSIATKKIAENVVSWISGGGKTLRTKHLPCSFFQQFIREQFPERSGNFKRL